MNGCRQVLAGILALLFVTTAVFALLIVNATHIVTNREAVKEALALETVLQEALPALVNNAIAAQVSVADTPLPTLDTAAITQSVLDTLPVGWLDSVADAAVDGVYDYLLTGEERTAVITLDVNPLLAQLQGEAGRLLVLKYLESLPVCSLAEMLSLLEGAILTCRPPGLPLDELSRQVHGVVAPMLLGQNLVGEGGIVRIPLAALFSTNPEITQMAQRLRFFYQLAPQAWLLWLPPLFCLLLILALAVRSWTQWGYWWGVPLALAGAAGLFFSALLPGMALGWVRTAVFTPTTSSNPLDSFWRPLLQQGVVQLAEMWAGRLGWQAGILFVLGLTFLFFGFLAGKIMLDGAKSSTSEIS